MATIDIAAYREREAQGLITCRAHPTDDLLIWNYTPKCVYERAWDEVTRQARGLITRSDGTIVSLCFKKFFNYLEPAGEGEPAPLLDGPITVTEKMDGSLGILYHDSAGSPAIATRGSFTSEQALRATVFLREKYRDYPFLPQYTYLFEIVLPENRIVVNYGEQEDLVLLAMIHTESGAEADIHDPRWTEGEGWPFPIVKRYEGLAGFQELVSRYQQEDEAGISGDEREGFVVRFTETGLRLKLKFSDYSRLHKLLTQCTARVIWASLREQKSLHELYDRVPPEFAAWVKETSRALTAEANRLQKETFQTYRRLRRETTIPVPDSLRGLDSLNAEQVQHLSGLMKRAIQRRFEEYPEIEYFLQVLYNGTKYTFPDRRQARDKEAVWFYVWDSLYPPASKPFRVAEELENGRKTIEEKEIVTV